MRVQALFPIATVCVLVLSQAAAGSQPQSPMLQAARRDSGSDVLSLPIGVVCCVLLTVAVLFARLAASRPASRARTFLWVAAGLGSVFLVVKGFELGIQIESGYLPRTSTFWTVHHLLTSVHALLVLVAIVVTLVLAGFGSHRSVETANRFPKRASAAARYWQFVWLAWMCLFVALYLLR